MLVFRINVTMLVKTVFILIIIQNILARPRNDKILSQNNLRRDNGYQFDRQGLANIHEDDLNHNIFEYEAEDGSKRQEVGTFIYKENEAEPILHIKGMYSYFDGDGRNYVIEYEADDNGSKMRGDIIPPLVPTLPPFINTNNSTTERPGFEGEVPPFELIIGSATLGTLVGGNLG